MSADARCPPFFDRGYRSVNDADLEGLPLTLVLLRPDHRPPAGRTSGDIAKELGGHDPLVA